MMFGNTHGFNATKADVSPLSRCLSWYASGGALRRRYGCSNVPLPRYVSHAESEPAGGGPMLGGRCGVQDNCRQGRGGQSSETYGRYRWMKCAAQMTPL